jgi:hypothetical protein
MCAAALWLTRRILLGAQGRACSECAQKYYRDANRLCQRCDNYIWILYIFAFLAAIAMAPLLLKVSKSQGFMSINIFVGTMQASPPSPSSPPRF